MGDAVIPDPVEERGEIRAAVKSIRREWREQVAAMVKASPRGKLGERVTMMRREIDIFDDWVEETGGEARAEFFVCALVAARATLADVAEEYALHAGLLWAFMSETEERLGRYYRAQRGVADALVGEVVPLVDSVEAGEGGGRGGGGGTSSPDVPWRRLQAEMRLKVAGKYDRGRFGEDKQVGTTSVPVINFVMGEGSVLNVAAPANQGVTYEHDIAGQLVGEGSIERGAQTGGDAGWREGGAPGGVAASADAGGA